MIQLDSKSKVWSPDWYELGRLFCRLMTERESSDWHYVIPADCSTDSPIKPPDFPKYFYSLFCKIKLILIRRYIFFIFTIASTRYYGTLVPIDKRLKQKRPVDNTKPRLYDPFSTDVYFNTKSLSSRPLSFNILQWYPGWYPVSRKHKKVWNYLHISGKLFRQRSNLEK